jgi:hypothetical protein
MADEQCRVRRIHITDEWEFRCEVHRLAERYRTFWRARNRMLEHIAAGHSDGGEAVTTA